MDMDAAKIAIDKACENSTLVDALVSMARWEVTRAQGQGDFLSFGVLFKPILDRFNRDPEVRSSKEVRICKMAMTTLLEMMQEIAIHEKSGRMSGEQQLNDIVLPLLHKFQNDLKKLHGR